MPGKITRDAEVPKEIPELMAMWSEIAGGYTVDHVLNASLQLTANAIMTKASVARLDLEMTLERAEEMFELIRESIRENHQRKAQTGDIPVKPGQ